MNARCRMLAVALMMMSGIAVARETIDFDFGWRFAHGPILNSESEDFYDGDPKFKWHPRTWENVDLPHDFQFLYQWEPVANRSRGYKQMGQGIYRKHFYVDPEWKGKHLSLDFGGIMCQGEIFINGIKVAESDYGYLGMEVPIEKCVHFGETNVVAVFASTGNVTGSRWYTGGGLYRSVKLVVRDAVSVSRHGVFVTTPKVTSDQAEVAVQVEIDGWTRQTNDLEVAVTIKDPSGQVIGKTSALAPKMVRLSRTAVALPMIEVARPWLWDIDTPSLYVAEVRLIKSGEELDRVSQRFGIRTVEFDNSYGFKLNGRKVFLQSMCNHHDLGGVGAAAYRRAIERQIRMMKRFGYNAIRCSHNPYSEDLYDLADELGLLVVDELVDKWGQHHMNGRPMCESFFDRITEWVRRDRNHPSVILWSLGNEMQHEECCYGFKSDDWGVTTFRIFDVVVKRWDPTRKSTAAMYPAGINGVAWNESKQAPEDFVCPPELCRITDVASINYRWNAYKGFVERVPHLNIFQSEATVLDCLLPFWGMDREHSIGLSYWGAIAYWGESGGWPMKGWNYSFFDHDLRPRPTAWLIRSAFVPDEPQVRIAVDEGKDVKMWNDVLVGHHKLLESWNRKVGDTVDLTVFTNCEEVELLLNCKSLGTRKNDSMKGSERNILKWKSVGWAAGKLEAVAKNGGKVVARHSLETTGPVARIVAVEETQDWHADGHDLKYLRFNAVDALSRIVHEADLELTVEVDGAASLIALDDGDQATDKLFNVSSKALRDGSLLAILRAGREPGNVTVKVSASNGLPPLKLEFKTAVK